MKIFTLIAITAGASVGILVVSFFSYNKNNEDASSFLRHHRSRLGLVYDPHTTGLKPPLEQLPKCPLRNLAAFKNGRVGRKYFDAVPKTLEGSNCLFFDCVNDVMCDNGDPTITMDQSHHVARTYFEICIASLMKKCAASAWIILLPLARYLACVERIGLFPGR
mmetsp:Transcript_8415/g.12640  ORF Transcript_8415/g.12640 Transcript_8415/m.12640 type:complete len:164 (-) Transcript_8415:601-1092(-)